MGGSNKKDKLKFTVKYQLNGARSYFSPNGTLMPAKMVTANVLQLVNPPVPNNAGLYPVAPVNFMGVGTTPAEAKDMALADAKAYYGAKDNLPDPEVVELEV